MSFLNNLRLKRLEKDAYQNYMGQEFKEIWETCKDYSSREILKLFTTYQAVQYVLNNNIPGDFIECGVAEGGNSMVIYKANLSKRTLWVYDTFEGMPKPSEFDIKMESGKYAMDYWENHKTDWTNHSLEEVKNNFRRIYPALKNINFIKGKVEDTIPKEAPEKISLLRLDTDFYESTKHELKYLYPKLVKGGILIIDDYDSWKGARKAVDEYFAEHKIKMFLIGNAITGRIGIK